MLPAAGGSHSASQVQFSLLACWIPSCVALPASPRKLHIAKCRYGGNRACASVMCVCVFVSPCLCPCSCPCSCTCAFHSVLPTTLKYISEHTTNQHHSNICTADSDEPQLPPSTPCSLPPHVWTYACLYVFTSVLVPVPVFACLCHDCVPVPVPARTSLCACA